MGSECTKEIEGQSSHSAKCKILEEKSNGMKLKFKIFTQPTLGALKGESHMLRLSIEVFVEPYVEV